MIPVVTIVAAAWFSMIVVHDGAILLALVAAVGVGVAALLLLVIAAEHGATSRSAAAPEVHRGMDAGQPIGRATASASGARMPWNSLGGRWVRAGVAVAVLVGLLVILNGRSGTDGGDSPQVAFAAPAAPIVLAEDHKKATKSNTAMPLRDPAIRGKEEPGESRSSSGAPRQSAPQRTPTHVPQSKPLEPVEPVEPVEPAKPVEPAEPAKPAKPVEPQAPAPPASVTTTAKPGKRLGNSQTTGNPVGSPGNGPGGTGPPGSKAGQG